MAAVIGFADEIVRDYLLFRGFMGALKALDLDIKSDKDRGFRPDRIVDHLSSCIYSLDLNGLREAWGHLDQRIFCRLEHSFLAAAKKLETALLRMYVVTCVTNSRHDKLTEFFEKMSPDLQGQVEWKDWFALPFLKTPEENPAFQAYFTRQWQDTMLMSLHNFLSVVFQSMATPILLSYEDELHHLSALKEENEMLRARLLNQSERTCSSFPHPVEVMDDFCVIAQEAPSNESQSRTLRSLIKNIGSGLPTSPLLGRRQHGNGSRRQTVDDNSAKPVIDKPVSAVKPKPRAPSAPPHHSSISSPAAPTAVARVRPQTEQDLARRAKESQFSPSDRSRIGSSMPTAPASSVILSGNDQKGSLILLSQEEYREHHSCITNCKFNCVGSVVASSDMEGVIKIWAPIPSPQTIASVMSRSSVLAMDWASKRDKLLLHGNISGQIKLYDIREKRTVNELGTESNSPLKEQKVLSISCSPTDAHFVSSSAPHTARISSRTDGGKVLLWDMRTLQIEKLLPVESVVNCCTFNHNGQLLVTGTSSGHVLLFDMRNCECIATWIAHEGQTLSVQFSTDETTCYTMGEDGKFTQWNINRTGQKMADIELHCGTAGQLGGSSSRHQPLGKLFAFDSNGNHILVCGTSGGIIYKNSSSPGGVVSPTLSLGGHKWPVVAVDWSTTVDCGTCLTGSVDGKIQISTLLSQ